MNPTLIYARVSTEDQAEKYGIPSQLRACREYALTHGLTILGEIIDDGITGATLDRPGLKRLRERIANGEAAVVLMLDADRLSRELVDLLQVKPELERKARVEFVTGKFEDSPQGRLFFSIKGAIGQFERENTRARTMRGLKERARSGKHCGGRVAYGYTAQDGLLVPDEHTASKVQEIYRWYAHEGMSVRGIAKRLRESGTPSWSNQPWSHVSVRRILRNETYAGVAYYGTHFIDGEGKQLLRPDLSARVMYPVPSLIDRALWDRAQAQLAKREDPKQNPHTGRPCLSYLLRGLLYCRCGRKMGGETGWRAYRCYGRDKLQNRGEICRGYVGAQVADSSVWRALVASLGDAQTLRGLIASREKELVERTRPETVEALAKRIARLRAKETHVMGLLCDPDLTQDHATLKAQYREAQRERLAVERELSAARAALVVPTPDAWIEETAGLLAEDLRRLDDPGERQAFVRGLVTRADWSGSDEIRLSCFFARELSQAPYRLFQFPGVQCVVTARLAA